MATTTTAAAVKPLLGILTCGLSCWICWRASFHHYYKNNNLWERSHLDTTTTRHLFFKPTPLYHHVQQTQGFYCQQECTPVPTTTATTATTTHDTTFCFSLQKGGAVLPHRVVNLAYQVDFAFSFFFPETASMSTTTTTTTTTTTATASSSSTSLTQTLQALPNMSLALRNEYGQDRPPIAMNLYIDHALAWLKNNTHHNNQLDTTSNDPGMTRMHIQYRPRQRRLKAYIDGMRIVRVRLPFDIRNLLGGTYNASLGIHFAQAQPLVCFANGQYVQLPADFQDE